MKYSSFCIAMNLPGTPVSDWVIRFLNIQLDISLVFERSKSSVLIISKVLAYSSIALDSLLSSKILISFEIDCALLFKTKSQWSSKNIIIPI